MGMTLLHDVSGAVSFLREQGARTLCSDTRRLRAGDAYLAWPGWPSDPRRHVSAALQQGAAACLVDTQGLDAFDFSDARIAALPQLKSAAGEIAHQFFATPSAQLKVLGVTGTNGKTSTAWWIAQALNALGQRCGVIGTLGVGEPAGPMQSTGLTTPDPVTLHGTLRRFVDAGCGACAIEASSIGLVEHRLDGLHIAVALFTNFTRDHLDFHGTEQAYWAAKATLFDWPGLQAAVINIDDDRGATLSQTLQDRAQLDVWTYAVERPARLRAQGLRFHDGQLHCVVHEDGSASSWPLALNLIGEHNLSNVLAVLGGLRALGVALSDAVRACAQLRPPAGRMQQVLLDDAPHATLPLAVVDYAHTPDALDKTLRALRPVAEDRGGELWCVFGCGGNRDTTKRPMMGAIAKRLADHVVVTSDNPRDEPPQYILSQILAGVTGHDEVCVIEDRAQAIRHALTRAAPQDVVLIAGKGHELTQEIAGKQWPFSDAEHARLALQARCAA